MTSDLFGRALGSLTPRAFQNAESARLLHALQLASGIYFHGNEGDVTFAKQGHDGGNDEATSKAYAHRAGVNCLGIDRFEGRYMLSGGADPSITIWDLESAERPSKSFTYRPADKVERSSSSHKYGITSVAFYPFDSLAFLSSSYDHTLKIYSTQSMTPSASFDLDSVVYSQAMSPIADHLLVACATQHPVVRLVDLRSGASAHSIAGHSGAVLSVAWSPRNEFILASGGVDGTVRIWDIRRSASSLGIMDLEDSVGVGGEDGYGSKARSRHRGKAHNGACNGVVWTDNGQFLVTAGHDERVRVWDVARGANALAHFGPIIKNKHLSTLLPLLVPGNMAPSGKQIMFYPNEKEILMFDLFEGTLFKRLRGPGMTGAQPSAGGAQKNIKNRATSLAWRAGDVAFYSAHSDGIIRAWLPRTTEESEADEDQTREAAGEDEDESRKRKRQALDDIFKDLTRQKITFT